MSLFFLFIVVPLIELMILLKLAEVTSFGWTFALVVFTGVVGAALARAQGWSVIRRMQQEMQAGKAPAKSLADALMIFVAGALLMTPGVLTDVFGFSLLIPFFRDRYRHAMIRWFRNNVHFTSVTTTHFSTQPFDDRGPSARGDRVSGDSTIGGDDGKVIDSYVVDRHEEKDG